MYSRFYGFQKSFVLYKITLKFKIEGKRVTRPKQIKVFENCISMSDLNAEPNTKLQFQPKLFLNGP